jgi:hypothetical protein
LQAAVTPSHAAAAVQAVVLRTSAAAKKAAAVVMDGSTETVRSPFQPAPLAKRRQSQPATLPSGAPCPQPGGGLTTILSGALPVDVDVEVQQDLNYDRRKWKHCFKRLTHMW